jgi:hypothetical protein
MYDVDVVMGSVIDLALAKSEEEVMVDVVLSTMYVRFFGGRKYVVRGEG